MTQDIIDSNQSAIDYNEGINYDLRRIAAPLSSLGIDFFAYNIFLKGSRYLGLMTDTDWCRKFYALDLDKYLLNDTLASRPESRVIWDASPTNPLVEEKRLNGIAHGYSIYKRRGDAIQAWHFATKPGNTQINDLYVNNFRLLDRFAYFFSQEADFANPSKLKNIAIFRNEHQLELPSESQTKTLDPDSFVKTTPIHTFTLQMKHDDIELSRRQAECLYFLCQGKTAKEIGVILNLSFRTVENNLAAIKDRTQISSKTQLANYFRESQIFSVFEDNFKNINIGDETNPSLTL